MALEDPANNVFYNKEIFDLQKEKQVLQHQYDFRQARIKRIESGF